MGRAARTSTEWLCNMIGVPLALNRSQYQPKIFSEAA